MLILTRIHLNSRSELQARIWRTTLGYMLKIMRMQLQNAEASRSLRDEIAYKRREFIERWCSDRETSKLALQSANETLQTKPPSAATLEYVNEVVGRAQAEALAQSGISDAAAAEEP